VRLRRVNVTATATTLRLTASVVEPDSLADPLSFRRPLMTSAVERFPLFGSGCLAAQLSQSGGHAFFGRRSSPHQRPHTSDDEASNPKVISFILPILLSLKPRHLLAFLKWGKLVQQNAGQHRLLCLVLWVGLSVSDWWSSFRLASLGHALNKQRLQLAPMISRS